MPNMILPKGAKTNSKYPPVIFYKLKNGLTLLILEKDFAPIISFTTVFKVGNIDCPQGKTGLAHMFEHMAFKGSQTINAINYTKEKAALKQEEALVRLLQKEELKPNANASKIKKLNAKLKLASKQALALIDKDEYWKIYNKLGEYGMNAMTSLDYTCYMVQLPANRLEHWMILESDRFKNFVLREFYKERAVIMQERRMCESDSARVIHEALCVAAFNVHPYHNPVIGWMDDIAHYTRTDAEKFYARYYTPANATIAIVGDVKAPMVIKLAEKYFGSWKKKKAAASLRIIEPPQNAEKQLKITFPAQPALAIGFHVPEITHSDMPALIMLSELLSGGKTGRFYKNLVEGKKIALYASAYPAIASRCPSLFLILAAPKSGFSNALLDEAIMSELSALKLFSPKAEELKRIINNYAAGMLRQMESNDGLGFMLAHNHQLLGNWRHDWEMLDKLKKVSPKDILAAAKKYLKRSNRTAVFLSPPEPKKSESEGEGEGECEEKGEGWGEGESSISKENRS